MAGVSSYMKNAIKSAGYIGIDVFKSYAPTLSNIGSETKETASNLYQAIKDFTGPDNTSDLSFKGVMKGAKDTAKNIWDNAIEDIKTGKFYNKERNDALGDDLASGFLGDMSFDFDFSFDDEDWGDEENFSEQDSAKAQISAEVETSKAIISSVNATGRGLAATIASTNAASTEYIVDSSRQNTEALYNLNKEGFGTVSKALMAINNTVSEFAKIGEPMTAYMQNGTAFFAKTGEQLESITQTLKQIEKNTTPVQLASGRRSNAPISIGSLLSDDTGVNFSELINNFKQQVNEYKDFLSFFTDMGKPVLNNKGKNISIVQMGLTALAKQLIPKAYSDSIKSFDESLKYGLGAGLAKLGRKKSSILGGPLGFILDMLIPEEDRKRTINTGRYEKGPVAWDGVARKALTDVIPTTLLQIYSAITNTNPLRYDYERGQFVTTDSIAKDFKDRKARYVKEAGGDFYEDVEKKVKAIYSGAQQKEMLDNIYKFFETTFDTGNHDLYGRTASDYGVDEKTFKLIKQVMNRYGRQGKYRNMNKWVTQTSASNVNYSDVLRGDEASGNSLIASMYSEAFGGKKGTEKTIFGLDQYGHNYYWYLQGIWQYTGYLANNIDALGGRGVKKGNAPNITKEFAQIPDDTVEETPIDYDNLYAQYRNEAEELKKAKEEKEEGIKKWIKESKWYGKGPVGKYLKKLLEKDPEATGGAFGFLNSVSDSIDRLIFGDENNPDGGLFNFMFKKAEKLFDQAKDWFKENIGEKVKTWWDKMFNEENGIFHGFWEETKENLKNVGSRVRNAGYRVLTGRDYVPKPRPSEAGATQDVIIEDEDNGSAAVGRKITKSGVVTVSAGEMIIPSELNPYYHGATNKQSQISREKYIRGKYLGEFANGNYNFNDTYMDSKGNYRNYTNGSLLGILSRGAADALSGLKNFISRETDEKKIKEEKEKMNKNLNKMLGEMGVAKGAIGAGGILGFVGGSFLGGPLLGAALGAGIGFASKSEAVQDFVFGELKTDENGNIIEGSRKRQKLYDFFKKELPNVGVGAALGTGAGIFFGSPLLGAFLGAGLGFAKGSDKFQNWLFGEKNADGTREDNGAIPLAVQKKLKAVIPSMAIGGLGGLVLGPFGGILPNILLGSTLGFAANTKKFQDKFFGNGEDDDKSLGSVIRNKIFGSIDNITHNFGNRLKIWGRKLGGSIAKFIHNRAKKLMDDSRNGRGGIFTKLVGGILRGGSWLGSKTVGAAVRGVGGVLEGVSNKVRDKNLHKGYSVYNRREKRNMTASERITTRLNHGIVGKAGDFVFDHFRDFDNFLASINSYGEMAKYKKLITDIKTYPEDSPEFQAAADALRNDEKFKQFMKGRDRIKFIKKNINQFEQLIADEAKRTDADGNLVFGEEGSTKLEQISSRSARILTEIKELLKAKLTKITDELNVEEVTEEEVRAEGYSEGESIEGEDIDFMDYSEGEGAAKGRKIIRRAGQIAVTAGELILPRALNPYYRARTQSIMDKGLNNISSENEVKRKTIYDMMGNPHQIITNNQGEEIEDKTDKETKESRKKMNSFMDSIGHIPLIGGVVDKLGKLFAPKDKEEKKESLLSKLLGGIGSIFSSVIKGGIGLLLSIPSVVAVGTAIGAIYSFLTGEDNPVTDLVNNIGDALNISGSGKTLYRDSEGNEIFKDETGDWYREKNGERIYDVNSTEINAAAGDRDTFTDNLFNTSVRQMGVTASKMYKGGYRKISNIAKGAVRNTSIFRGLISGKTAIGKLGKVVDSGVSKIVDGFKKVLEWIAKQPFAKKIGELIKKGMDTIVSKFATIVGKSSSELIAKASAKVGAAISGLGAAVMIQAAEHGHDTAKRILGVLEVSEFERVICAAVNVIKDLSFVMMFVDLETLVDLFMMIGGENLGGYAAELAARRKQCKETVEAYNEANGTNYDVDEYLMIVEGEVDLHEYSGALKKQYDERNEARKKEGLSLFGYASKAFNEDVNSNTNNAVAAGITGAGTWLEAALTASGFAGSSGVGALATEGLAGNLKGFGSGFNALNDDDKGGVETFADTFESIWSGGSAYKGDSWLMKGLTGAASVPGKLLGTGLAAGFSVGKGLVGNKLADLAGNLADSKAQKEYAKLDEAAMKPIYNKCVTKINLAKATNDPEKFEQALIEVQDELRKAGFTEDEIASFSTKAKEASDRMYSNKISEAMWKGVGNQLKSAIDEIDKIKKQMAEYAADGDLESINNMQIPDNPELTMARSKYLIEAMNVRIANSFGLNKKDNSSGFTSLITAAKSVVSSVMGTKNVPAGMTSSVAIGESVKALGGRQRYVIFYVADGNGNTIVDGFEDITTGEYYPATISGDKATLTNGEGKVIAEFSNKNDPNTLVDKTGSEFSYIINGSTVHSSSSGLAHGGSGGKIGSSSSNTHVSSSGVIHGGSAGKFGGASGVIDPALQSSAYVGTNFVSQNNPKYSNLRIGDKSVAASGCGPAVASMAVSAFGASLPMEQAVQMTEGFTGGNGVSTRYFDDVFDRTGIAHKNTNNTSEIRDNLAKGNPVVLLGKDSSNKSKDRSPFGPNNHFVLATGMKNGKVLIADPESNGLKAYNTNILAKTSDGIAATAFGAGYGGGVDFNPENTTAQNIWAYLTQKEGFSPAGAAATLGAWQEESLINPDVFEGNYLGLASKEDISTRQGLSDYTLNKLFPVYARQGLSINDDYYKAEDGLYYAGLGLAQWTGPRGKILLDFADKNNLNWTDLDPQMQMFSRDINEDSYYKNLDVKGDMQKASDVANATAQFAKFYEGNDNSSGYPDRIEEAKAIYNAFKDKNFTYNGNASGSSYTGDSDTGEVDGGDLLSVLSNIFGSISSIFDLKNGFHLGSISSGDEGDTTGTSSSSGLNSLTGGTGHAREKQILLDRMKSIENKIPYSLSGPQDPDKGSSACASTVYWAYKKMFQDTNQDVDFDEVNMPGIIAGAGNWTRAKNFTKVWSADGQGISDEDAAKLQTGDVLVYRWEEWPNINLMDHAEMFAGYDENGNGHAWTQSGMYNGYGTNYVDFNDYRKNHLRRVMRYDGFATPDLGPTYTSTGTNINSKYDYDANNTKKEKEEYNKLANTFGNSISYSSWSPSDYPKLTRYLTLKKKYDKDYSKYISLKNRYGTKKQPNINSGSDYKDWKTYQSLKTKYGGSSGIILNGYNPTPTKSSKLLRKAKPSSYVYGAKKGSPFKFGASSRGIKKRFGGASGLATNNINRQTTVLLNNIRGEVANSAGRGGVSPYLVNQLLDSIAKLLQTIATNTSPVAQIYEVLAKYIAGKAEVPVTTSGSKPPVTEEEIDSNLASLVSTLQAIARG